MKHKYADLFTAKLNDIGLVLLHKHKNWSEWRVDEDSCGESTPHFMVSNSFEYFLCLPQHKEAVLNVLNGGQSQANYGEFWQEVNCSQPTKWSRDWWYMSAHCESRIKPKKERRWIGVHPDGHCGGTHFDGYAKAENDSPIGYQIIEIEVEV